MDEGIHRTSFFDRKNLGHIEPLHFASNLRVKSARIKARDSSDSGPTVNDIVPSRWNVVTHWAYDA
jgi:hypothetical protein